MKKLHIISLLTILLLSGSFQLQAQSGPDHLQRCEQTRPYDFRVSETAIFVTSPARVRFVLAQKLNALKRQAQIRADQLCGGKDCLNGDCKGEIRTDDHVRIVNRIALPGGLVKIIAKVAIGVHGTCGCQ